MLSCEGNVPLDFTPSTDIQHDQQRAGIPVVGFTAVVTNSFGFKERGPVVEFGLGGAGVGVPARDGEEEVGFAGADKLWAPACLHAGCWMQGSCGLSRV